MLHVAYPVECCCVLLEVFLSFSEPMPTRIQQLPTLLVQQCRELLRPFTLSLLLMSLATELRLGATLRSLAFANYFMYLYA